MLLKKEFLLFCLGILVGFLGLLIFYPQKKYDPVVFTKAEDCLSDDTKEPSIVIDVSGAVSDPGVYTLNPGSRISDAINSAGGVLDTVADKSFLSKNINLAQLLQDGDKIYIPVEGDSTRTYYSIGPDGETGVVNINTASESALAENLSGIGPVYAKKIVEGRPYNKVEELYEKNIIPKSIFDKIKDDISIN